MDDLVRLMSPVLWHVVRAYGLERTAAEDAVQTTWLQLVRTHERISDDRAVSAWLTTTARREAWRTVSKDRRTDAADDDTLDALLPWQESAEAQATTRASNNALWTALEQLTDRCRRLLRVIAFEDRPDYQRLAADLNMPVGSIGPTRRRCLVKLRSLIEPPTGETT